MTDSIRPDQFIVRGHFTDPTPTGIIFKRFVTALSEFAAHAPITEAERATFARLLVMVANKLGAVWYHGSCYTMREGLCVTAAKANPITGKEKVVIDCEPVLFYELDAFLVQVKSCLDHLVKIPQCFIGPAWNLTTFGAKGEDVANAVRNQVPAAMKKTAEGFLLLLERNQVWLTDVISTRDRLNHLLGGGILPDQFLVFADARAGGPEPRVVVPMWAPDATVGQMMDVVFQSLFMFCEDFVAMSAVLRFPREIRAVHLNLKSYSVKSPWTITPLSVVEAMNLNEGWDPFVPRPARAKPPHPKAPCHCGSGKLYKNCHLSADQAVLRSAKG